MDGPLMMGRQQIHHIPPDGRHYWSRSLERAVQQRGVLEPQQSNSRFRLAAAVVTSTVLSLTAACRASASSSGGVAFHVKTQRALMMRLLPNACRTSASLRHFLAALFLMNFLGLGPSKLCTLVRRELLELDL